MLFWITWTKFIYEFLNEKKIIYDLVGYLAYIIILDDDVGQEFCYFHPLLMDYQ